MGNARKSLLTGIVAAVAAPLALSGCFDGEMKVAIDSADKITTTFTVSSDRDFFDRAGGDSKKFCEDGKGAITETKAVCVREAVRSIAEIEAGGDTDGLSFTDLGGGRIRFEASFEDVLRKQAERAGAGEDILAMQDNPILQAIKAQLAGHALTFKVVGRHVSDTNMELSEDGRSASFSIPLDSMMEPGGMKFPEKVYAVVDTKSCWLFGTLCF